VDAVLADYRTAPITSTLRAMLGYLEKVTLHPDEVTADDAEALHAAGLTDEAIIDAVHVCAMFNIYDRLADAMAWHVPAEPDFWPKQTQYLLKYGYEGGRKPTGTA
jgi:uncharacterized peroxidase-related enzyme